MEQKGKRAHEYGQKCGDFWGGEGSVTRGLNGDGKLQ